ncbi:MAG: hypothetical protein ACK52I_28835 [Pseudomonadota bacterium]
MDTSESATGPPLVDTGPLCEEPVTGAESAAGASSGLVLRHPMPNDANVPTTTSERKA